MAETDLRSSRFRDEREADWRRLETLVDMAEARGARSLSFEESRDLAALYRNVASSLSVAREITLDKSLLAYLEALAARAYLAVYAQQDSLGGVLSRFFASGAPQAMRRSAIYILAGFAAMGLGATVGWLLFLEDPDWYDVFVPGGGGDTRGPAASTEELLSYIYDEDASLIGALTAFSAFLFSHNTRIAIFAFSLGVFAAFPTLLLLIYNGLLLGAFVALHVERGIGWDIFGWLSVHGVTELSAICIAGAGGLQLGAAVLFPGRRTRRDALRHEGRDAAKLAIVAALMLFVAALLEGFARQLIQTTEVRLAVGWGIGALWLVWFALAGRR
ncbi:MAG: stage II sporulation protein M [Pseudomonadota bacterium]